MANLGRRLIAWASVTLSRYSTSSESPRAAVAREVAARTIHRVTERDAWAMPTLDAELKASGADPRDAALATEIVYGTLRVLPALDAAIAQHLRRPDQKLDGYLRALLRVTAYQIRHLSRVPPYAAVDDAVSLAKRERGAKAGGFVNAIARRLAADRPVDPSPAQAVVVAEWVRQEIEDSLGADRAEAFWEARALPPPIGLRCNRLRTDPATLQRAIQDERPRASVEPSPVCDGALLISHAGDPRTLAAHGAGHFSVQEEGSQLVGLLVGAMRGERIADICAGHGGKTTLLAEIVGPTGHVTAVDLHAEKLTRIASEVARLGIDPAAIETQAIDLTVGTGSLGADFDRVLVDAPCTGLGTIHRRPELLLRLRPDDPARLAAVQLAILERAAGLVRPGGTLTFAVCSPTRAEGAGVIGAFLAAHPSFQTRPPPSSRGAAAIETEKREGPDPIGCPAPDADGIIRLGPWMTPSGSGPDAYQIWSGVREPFDIAKTGG